MSKKIFIPHFLKNYFVYSLLFTILITTLPRSYGETVFSIKQLKEPDNIGYCLTDYVSVHYDDPEDYFTACEGITRAETFFKNHLNDYSRKPVKIIFGDSHNFTDENIKKPLMDNFGIYFPKQSIIIIKPWKAVTHKIYLDHFPMSQNLFSSIVTHEISHYFHHTYITNQGKKFLLLETEFLATIAQWETMENPEKTDFLDYFKNRGNHFTRDNIHILIYKIDPLLFAVVAYKDYLKTSDIIQHILNGQKIGSNPRTPYNR